MDRTIVTTSVFSAAELAYLTNDAGLGRLATVDSAGAPHVVPTGWTYNAELDTIDVGGRDLTATRKFRNVRAHPQVCLVIDDVQPPWHPRCVQVRGEAEAIPHMTGPDGEDHGAIIRILPTRVVSWGLDGGD
ncbi:MAG: PPOX class F420-dependent oxidoreductase [Streptosporangiales bacterium]|nr:PPOX class F420-dependent oxidoreductase [Streptosporangiales bacterium]